MRVVFFGTPDFAVPTLEKLLSEPDFEVVGVVSQPDTLQPFFKIYWFGFKRKAL